MNDLTTAAAADDLHIAPVNWAGFSREMCPACEGNGGVHRAESPDGRPGCLTTWDECPVCLGEGLRPATPEAEDVKVDVESIGTARAQGTQVHLIVFGEKYLIQTQPETSQVWAYHLASSVLVWGGQLFGDVEVSELKRAIITDWMERLEIAAR